MHVEYRTIPLTKGAVAKVSPDDYATLAKHSWYLHSAGYAARTVRVKGTRKKHVEYMHRVIVGAPKGMRVDHADHDPLNNTRGNLRVCTNGQNLQNQKAVRGRVPYKGVTFYSGEKRLRPYVAWLGGKNLGYFATAEEAAREYDKHAREAYGEFAYLNFE